MEVLKVHIHVHNVIHVAIARAVNNHSMCVNITYKVKIGLDCDSHPHLVCLAVSLNSSFILITSPLFFGYSIGSRVYSVLYMYMQYIYILNLCTLYASYVCTFKCTQKVSSWDCPLLTSTEDDDYTALTETVTLTPTDVQQCVSVMIEDDPVLEETESLAVSLSLIGVVDSIQLSIQTTTIVITDDDSKRPIIHVHVYIFTCTLLS